MLLLRCQPVRAKAKVEQIKFNNFTFCLKTWTADVKGNEYDDNEENIIAMHCCGY